jgi:membrane associated rhomboid family serine protease
MFVPLRDINPSRTAPVVTIGLIAANVVVFAHEASLGAAQEAFVMSYAAIPGRVTGALAVPRGATEPWVTLVSHMFLHGGLWHLLGNMWFLWLFGDNVEDAMGKLRFLAFYLLGGIAAALSHVYAEPMSRIPMLGASGAISAVLGAYVVLYPAARVRTLFWFFIIIRVFDIPAFIYLGVWFLMQVLSAGAGGGIAWYAHIGGFVAGIVLQVFFVRRRRR